MLIMPIIKKIKSILAEQFGENEDSITLDTNLTEDLGADSLDLADILMGIEDEFGVRFDEPVPFETVQDVLDYLEKHAKKK